MCSTTEGASVQQELLKAEGEGKPRLEEEDDNNVVWSPLVPETPRIKRDWKPLSQHSLLSCILYRQTVFLLGFQVPRFRVTVMGQNSNLHHMMVLERKKQHCTRTKRGSNLNLPPHSSESNGEKTFFRHTWYRTTGSW